MTGSSRLSWDRSTRLKDGGWEAWSAERAAVQGFLHTLLADAAVRRANHTAEDAHWDCARKARRSR